MRDLSQSPTLGVAFNDMFIFRAHLIFLAISDIFVRVIR